LILTFRIKRRKIAIAIDSSFRPLGQPLAHAKFFLSLDNAEIRENVLALSER